jgi:molecular chaperone GrpE
VPNTDAQQGGDPEVEAQPSSAPEPDKLTAAQQGGDPAAEAAPGPEAEVGAEAVEEDDTAAQQEGDPEAEGAPGAEAEDESEAEDQDEAQDEVVTERADEEPEGDGEADAPAAMAADLDAAKARAESYLDDLRRLQADFDNYRKRTLREQTARAASASQALVARLLPVLDNFELAVSHAEQSRDFDGMLKGVEMVFGELREVLQGEGLVKIEAEGKPFDPERHEAVVAVEHEGAEPGTVVDVVRNGYELRGRVLRPAMVKVAK